MVREGWLLTKTIRRIILAINLGLAAVTAAAQDFETTSRTNLFAHGESEVTLANGVMFSPMGNVHRPTVNYTVTEMQFGYMLSNAKGDGWWHGNFETALSGFGSAIYDGPGDFIAGATLWLRYNFVPRGSSRLTPFLQGGAGVTWTDLDHDFVGQAFNFNLQLAAGARFFIADHWSLNLEYRYQHISNAGMGEHNVGINAQGPILGLSYFF
jgi:opacity protein-like surface antigen